MNFLRTAHPVSNGHQGQPNENHIYRYFVVAFPYRQPSIMAKSYFAVGFNNRNMMKDKKIQVFSFPDNNDKHLENIDLCSRGTGICRH